MESETRPILSVAKLTREIKSILEGRFPSVWVNGEISNLARPHSGHLYLTLKDDKAQIRAAIWRNTAKAIRFDLQDGQEVIVEGALDVYGPRGSYQLIIRQIEPKGVGALQLALKQLHKKLEAEGLFAAELKRDLPTFPKQIAFVTSPTGAAIRDFLEVIRRRWLGVDVLIIPCRVQGEGAAREIASAIERVNRLSPAPDTLVVGRGGGSLEDLWCFNEEPVVRAIYDSKIPVVSAVGHDIDVTLSDLVADVRAATPSEAAELVVPSSDAVSGIVENLKGRLVYSLKAKAEHARARLENLAQRTVFRRPFDRINDCKRDIDDLQMRATRSLQQTVNDHQNQSTALAARLHALSPLKVLGRGYSVSRKMESKEVVRNAADVQPGEMVETLLAKGRLISRVEEVQTSDDDLRRD